MEGKAVEILISKNAASLEMYAADELAAYLNRLFGISAVISSKPDGKPSYRFVLCLDKDPLLKKHMENVPVLSDQGHIVSKKSPDTVILAGGSPKAAVWAVYELIKCYGVRFLIHEDIFPEDPGRFYLPDIDAVFEPLQKLRSCMLFNELATGSVLWGLDQYRKFIRQIFKLKFNGIMILSFPQSPLTEYEVKGIRRSSGCLLFDQKIPVDRENIGYERLPCDPYYSNPDLSGIGDFTDLLAAVKKLIQTIINEAKRYDMHTALCIMPLEFPLEFGILLGKPSKDAQLGGQTTSEMGDLTGKDHMDLVYAQVDSLLSTYSGIDEIIFDFPEHPQAESLYVKSWVRLAAKYDLGSGINIDKMLSAARNDHIPFGGSERAERDLKSAISMLDFFDVFMASNDLLTKAKVRNIRFSICISAYAAEVFPAIGRILWKDAAFYTSLDYTSSRAVRSMQNLERIDSSVCPSYYIFRLQDDNIGSLPQICTGSVHVLMDEIRRLGWKGFGTVFWPLGDLDPMFAYLSQAAWDHSVTVEKAYTDHFVNVYGHDAARQLCQAMLLLEDATVLLDIGLGPFFPVSGVMDKFIRSKTQMPEIYFHVRAIYEQVLRIFRQAESTVITVSGKKYLSYWMARMEFSIHAFNETELLCEGGSAAETKHTALAKEFYDRAVLEGEAALKALAGNVWDDSDRSTLAAYHHFFVREVKMISADYLRGK
jgi:hypothetical protein